MVDDDGGPSLGVVVDVVFGGLADGLKVEGVFSREPTDLEVRTGIFDPPGSVRVEVDQLLIGGIQDLVDGRVRPFLSGLLGITRYAVPGDTEVRFSLGVGAGVKFYATRQPGRASGRAGLHDGHRSRRLGDLRRLRLRDPLQRVAGVSGRFHRGPAPRVLSAADLMRRPVKRTAPTPSENPRTLIAPMA